MRKRQPLKMTWRNRLDVYIYSIYVCVSLRSFYARMLQRFSYHMSNQLFGYVKCYTVKLLYTNFTISNTIFTYSYRQIVSAAADAVFSLASLIKWFGLQFWLIKTIFDLSWNTQTHTHARKYYFFEQFKLYAHFVAKKKNLIEKSFRFYLIGKWNIFYFFFFLCVYWKHRENNFLRFDRFNTL